MAKSHSITKTTTPLLARLRSMHDSVAEEQSIAVVYKDIIAASIAA